MKTIFCANCQSEQPHALSADQNGEILATCSVCERVLKFPAGINKTDFRAKIVAQKEVNQGQISQESIEANLAELSADDEVVESPQDGDVAPK